MGKQKYAWITAVADVFCGRDTLDGGGDVDQKYFLAADFETWAGVHGVSGYGADVHFYCAGVVLVMNRSRGGGGRWIAVGIDEWGSRARREAFGPQWTTTGRSEDGMLLRTASKGKAATATLWPALFNPPLAPAQKFPRSVRFCTRGAGMQLT